MSKEKLKKKEQKYGPGNVLRRKREEYEWSIEAVAEALHLSTASINSIENDRYDELPGATYILGYWRSYSRLLDIDMEDTIEANKRNLDLVGTHSSGLDLGASYHPGKKSNTLIWLVSFILFLGLAFFIWQQNFFGLFGLSTDSDKNSVVSVEQSNLQDSAEYEDAREGVLIAIEDPKASLISPEGAEIQDNEQSEIESVSLSSAEADLSVGAARSDSDLEPQNENADEGQAQASRSEQASSVNSPDGLVLRDDTALSDSASTEQKSDEANNAGSRAEQAQDEIADLEQDSAAKADQADSSSNSPEQKTESDQGETVTTSESNADGSFVLLKLSKDSWLDVRDSTNKRLVYATKKSGSDIKVVGTPPFYVYIGTPSGVKVRYKGKDVPFQTHKSGLFARFKIGSSLQAL